QVLALNKVDAVDGATLAELLAEFEGLGLGPVYGISAVAGTGLPPMLQRIWTLLDAAIAAEARAAELAAAPVIVDPVTPF
ncbi:MAG TPA: hypothetical protein VLS96_18515, partial [Nodosilinea sp.]|nr:hypothetical protein [Nodosilinea sp.]